MPSPPADLKRKRAREFSGGLKARDLPGLWRKDWHRAYAILTRDQPEEEEPSGRVRRFFSSSKKFLSGLAYKLSPPRRLLLAICLVLTVLGLQTENVENLQEKVEVFRHPILLLLAVVGLFFLLVLELADRVLVRDELEVARQIQRDLLPVKAPPVPGHHFAFSYRSANTVGGDYYDFLPLEDNRLAVAIGDASGHGIAAAMLMAISRTTLRLAVETDPSPPAVARMMNRALVDTGGSRAFLTLFYGLLDLATGRLEFVCAGHPYPLLRRSGGEILRLGEGAFPLGLRSRFEPSSGSVVLASGDLLVLYSDGIPEAIDPEGEAFGFDRLESGLAAGGSPEEVHERIVRALATFVKGESYHDDLSLVVIARNGDRSSAVSS